MVIEIKFILTVKKKKRKRSVEIIPSTFRFKTSWEKNMLFTQTKNSDSDSKNLDSLT